MYPYVYMYLHKTTYIYGYLYKCPLPKSENITDFYEIINVNSMDDNTCIKLHTFFGGLEDAKKCELLCISVLLCKLAIDKYIIITNQSGLCAYWLYNSVAGM